MKKLILSAFCFFVVTATNAQTVNVHFKNGQVINYNADNVEYVDFSAKAPDPTLTAGEVVDLGLSAIGHHVILEPRNLKKLAIIMRGEKHHPKQAIQ